MQVNIVLENKNEKEKSKPEWVGTIFFEGPKESEPNNSLDYLRGQIIDQFDSSQMSSLQKQNKKKGCQNINNFFFPPSKTKQNKTVSMGGNDFQFLNEGIPVSRKQEKYLTWIDIGLVTNKWVGSSEDDEPRKEKTEKSGKKAGG
ncbi:hypothetical protein RFI_14995, partial [Reticulomyxa filosa]